MQGLAFPNGTGADMSRTIVVGTLWVSIYETFVLNLCGAARSTVSKMAVVCGNFWATPINMPCTAQATW